MIRQNKKGKRMRPWPQLWSGEYFYLSEKPFVQHVSNFLVSGELLRRVSREKLASVDWILGTYSGHGVSAGRPYSPVPVS